MSWTDMTHAVLPQAVFLPLWVKLSWALVASAVVLRLTYACKPTLWPAAVVAVVMLLPRTDVLSGYLALAFQTPSLVLVAWALWCWADVLQLRGPVVTTPLPVALLGVLLGWALVLDTLNYWPTFFNPQLYALGFDAAGLWGVLATAAAVLLWTEVPRRWVLSAVAVLAVYVLLRLPTGNVWDAVLDPFVWLALHVQLWRTWRASRAV
ncbi:hypothetical protein B9Z44_08805 [Limnohabitans curvus]|jgi:hypothetical protein|uniref:Uncharacterized protein n=1 Tax=Limnohabitans curvus TaxID=323423 RepID=A0A315ES96_9BURK|nr:hypothetical protein [Limnohabitans curvus]PUE59665.1 hypothetical protein B9Z44_08805 [Limnohabitans curvus]